MMADRCGVTSADGERCWLIGHDTLCHVYFVKGWMQIFTVCSTGPFVNYDNNDPHINDQQPEVLRGETQADTPKR